MARSFNGSSDIINCGGASGSLDVATGGTIAIACWVQWPSLPVGAVNTVFAKGYDGSTGYALTIDNSPSLNFTTFTSSTTRGATWSYGSALISATWYQIYADFDGTHWHLFLNGSSVLTPVADTLGPTHTTQVFSMGAVYTSGTGGSPIQYGGMTGLADVAIWDGPLSSTNITDLAGTTGGPFGSPGSAKRANAITTSRNLLGYWPLQGTTSPEPDLSTGGHPGTLVAAPGFFADPTELQPLGGPAPLVLGTLKRRFLRR